MRLLLRLGRGSKGYTSQCPIMDSTMSHCSLLFIEVAWQACGNIANSNGSYGEEYDRTNRSSTHHSIESDEKLRKDVKSLNEKLDKLILAQSTMKKVNFVSAEEMEPVQEGEDTQFAEVCYMSNGQGGYNKGYYNYKSNPAMSYRNTDVANPQDQVYPQQQQARSSQAPQHGYGPKNNYQGPQGTFPGQQMHIPPGFPHQPLLVYTPIQPLTSSWKLWIIELAFVWRWFHVIRTSGSEDTTILVGLDPPARPASFQLDRAAFPGVKVKPEKCCFPLTPL
ncbi:unnamed protein product [Microthlaspi erraticum]|uniref:Uncharacterized protein n=1 Tax=Microthlaspi erraticum TaxID=1685480 RepID=A0A6D2JMP3_9BRAS|nr:unnamed protein product [Microthlaspi erraticum]